MNYIYDIVLNFQNNYYQFFEWNRNDKIKNISKIILYHIKDKDLNDLMYNKVIIDEHFLAILKEKTQKYKKIMCLVSNTKQTIGLLFSNDGILLKRSSLLFEEENEVNSLAKDLPVTFITYKENQFVEPNNKLRIEIEKKDSLINFINQTNDILTLKYLYYEYFKKECNDKDLIKKTLLKEIEKEWNENQHNLYKIIKILTKKNYKSKKTSI